MNVSTPALTLEDYKSNYTINELKRTSQIFWEHLFVTGDIIEYRKFPSHRSSYITVGEDGAGRKLAALRKSNQEGQEIFFGINPRIKVGGRDSGSVATYRSVMVSFKETPIVARSMWQGTGLAALPTLIIDLKDSCLFFARLKEPLDDRYDWGDLQLAISNLTGGDCFRDPPRVVHAPGFWMHGKNAVCSIYQSNYGAVLDGGKVKEIAEFIDENTAYSE